MPDTPCDGSTHGATRADDPVRADDRPMPDTGGAAPRPARPARTDPGSDRPTGDDYAQAELGGTRGHPSLAPAPMTPQRAKKTPTTPGDGHTA